MENKTEAMWLLLETNYNNLTKQHAGLTAECRKMVKLLKRAAIGEDISADAAAYLAGYADSIRF